MTQSSKTSSLFMTLAGAGLLVLGAVGGWMFERQRTVRNTTAEIGPAVRAYLLENPEVLREAFERLNQKETASRLSSVADDVIKPFPGAILGNPNGKVTLVEFTDYACTYCRKSVEDVDRLVKAHPDLKVVVRELPILSPQSGDAARWALAAAEQGRYPQYHAAMFAAGRPDAQTIEAAARVAGLDMDRARKFIADPKVNAELQGNIRFAQALGFDGTPAWVIGDQALSGAVGYDVLAKAIEQAR
ncbi:DsbA family protein [Novosphingobium sp.]|uniref:DsbA family protein n=1 Tax=Novosphingobium sp. TaxID=1874826 RepID=UPI0035B4F6D0